MISGNVLTFWRFQDVLNITLAENSLTVAYSTLLSTEIDHVNTPNA